MNFDEDLVKMVGTQVLTILYLTKGNGALSAQLVAAQEKLAATTEGKDAVLQAVADEGARDGSSPHPADTAPPLTVVEGDVA